MPQVGDDIRHFFHVNQSWKSFFYVAKKLLRTWLDIAIYRRPVQRSNGNALITRLLREAIDLGVELRRSTPATSLSTTSEGMVTGARLGGRTPVVVTARRGVILASGGFSGDRSLRAEMFEHDPQGTNHFTPTVGHTGDAIRLARPVGGVVDSALSSVASWAPVTVFRYLRGGQRLFPHLRAIGLPGLLAVDREGRRFGNEALSYHDFGRTMIAQDADRPDTFAWLLADARSMHKYGIGYAKPWPMPRGYFHRTGYLVKGASVAELACKIGVDARTLAETLEDFNSDALRGEDTRFGRGSTEYNHFRGDPEHLPNPNLAPLNKAPYFAARIRMGDLGTFAGLATDESARVLDGAGRPIPHLYAAGSAAASVFGGGYPGYGANIGPALVFGYRAGCEVASRPE